MSKFILFLWLFVFAFFSLPLRNVSAVVSTACNGRYGSYVESVEFPEEANIGDRITIKVKFTSQVQQDNTYYIRISDEGTINATDRASNTITYNSSNPYSTAKATQVFNLTGFDVPGSYRVKVTYSGIGGSSIGENEVCSPGSIRIRDKQIEELQCSITLPTSIKSGDTPDIKLTVPAGNTLRYRIYFAPQSNINLPTQILTTAEQFSKGRPIGGSDIKATTTLKFPNNAQNDNYVMYAIAIKEYGITQSNRIKLCAVQNFSVSNDATSSPVNSTPLPTSAPGSATKSQPGGPQSSAGGIRCTDSPQGIMTAIGCIPTEPKAFVEGILKLGAGAGGGIAFLMIVFGVIQMITSHGDAATLKKGQEQASAAVIGLLFIIFSILLLRIIGVDLLGIFPK